MAARDGIGARGGGADSEESSAGPTRRPRNSARLGQLDLDIIERLQIDGRASFRQIAADLAVGVNTVRARVNHLVREGLIRIVAIPNVLEGLETVLTLVQLKVVGEPDRVANMLASRPDIPWIVVTTGGADIILSIYSSGLPSLLRTLRAINDIQEVARLESFVCLDVLKHGYVRPFAGSEQGGT